MPKIHSTHRSRCLPSLTTPSQGQRSTGSIPRPALVQHTTSTPIHPTRSAIFPKSMAENPLTPRALVLNSLKRSLTAQHYTQNRLQVSARKCIDSPSPVVLLVPSRLLLRAKITVMICTEVSHPAVRSSKHTTAPTNQSPPCHLL